MPKDILEIIEQFVDHLMPELTPYEAAMYIFLLRNSHLKNLEEIRIGKRTIAEKWGTGARGKKTNYAHVTDLVKGLEKKGCLIIGDVNREGTLYKVLLPKDIPLVKEKLSAIPQVGEEDYFTDPERRQELFERDKWVCCYCGDKVTEKNATLDHLNPQSKGGKHNKDNLKTCCFVCNAIKSGKTYEEAAPLLLKSIKERKQKS